MNIHLELPKELESELSAEASRLNLSLKDYILQVLFTHLSLQNPPKTGAELVTYWESIGVIGSRPDITDSQEHARLLRHKAETRDRA